MTNFNDRKARSKTYSKCSWMHRTDALKLSAFEMFEGLESHIYPMLTLCALEPSFRQASLSFPASVRVLECVWSSSIAWLVHIFSPLDSSPWSGIGITGEMSKMRVRGSFEDHFSTYSSARILSLPFEERILCDDLAVHFLFPFVM